MQPNSKIMLACGLTLFSYQNALATIPNRDHPTTFLGPTLKASYTQGVRDTAGISLSGEAGLRNLRAGMTLAFKVQDYARFKLSGEFLWQKMTYPFFAGDTDQWAHQGAIGADYQYLMGYDYNPQFDLIAYGSYAPTKNLGTVAGFFTRGGITESFIDVRRIAGSHAAGMGPRLTIEPLDGTRIGIEADYDNVRYDNKYIGNHDAKGFGGTALLTQALSENLDLNLVAGIRQPFNSYTASLDFKNMQYKGTWKVGVFGDYTVGKRTLNNSYNVGLCADFFIDRYVEARAAPVSDYKNEYDLKGEMPLPPAAWIRVQDPFLNWVENPAVHIPEVLAIADQHVVIGAV